ncbi:DUF222 domain-containing protein [Amycolatopsis cihanbeyliensis]|uniref:DUF222 domain-containing protein n=1 Tax=Amycolatopsis cihanbeyliensis TaxID=1128664 RepID=UPI0011517786|nr:DUF222 domain-containing protein [Amycolatopsis cihanbeyliensis]
MNDTNIDVPGWTTDELLATPTDDLTEQEALTFLYGISRMQAMLDAVRMKAIERFATLRADDERVRDILAAELKVTSAKAGDDLALAHTLHTRLPRTRHALTTGILDLARARQIDRATTPLTDGQARQVEELAFPQAVDRNPRRLYELLRKAVQEVDPDGAAARTAVRREQRRVSLGPKKDGMCWLHAFLPAEDGIAIDSLVDSAAREARMPGDERTTNQLRADALRDLILGTHRQRVASPHPPHRQRHHRPRQPPRRAPWLRPASRRTHPRTRLHPQGHLPGRGHHQLPVHRPHHRPHPAARPHLPVPGLQRPRRPLRHRPQNPLRQGRSHRQW